MFHEIATIEQSHLLVLIYCLELVSLACFLEDVWTVERKTNMPFALFVQESQNTTN